MNTTIDTEKLILLSKNGMKDLKKSIAHLEHERIEIIAELRELDKTYGHDEQLQRVEKLAQLEVIEANIEEKNHLLSRSRLISSKRKRLEVAIGSVVDLIDQQGRLFRYTIVNSFEADPSDGRISIASPLGRNLIGKTVQDVVEWSQGMRVGRLQLVRIM